MSNVELVQYCTSIENNCRVCRHKYRCEKFYDWFHKTPFIAKMEIERRKKNDNIRIN